MGVTTFGRASFRWQARNLCKALTGMVAYELADFEGREVQIPFSPRVVYDEDFAPTPWLVVF